MDQWIENGVLEITQTKQKKRKKRIFEKEGNLRDFWDKNILAFVLEGTQKRREKKG